MRRSRIEVLEALEQMIEARAGMICETCGQVIRVTHENNPMRMQHYLRFHCHGRVLSVAIDEETIVSNPEMFWRALKNFNPFPVDKRRMQAEVNKLRAGGRILPGQLVAIGLDGKAEVYDPNTGGTPIGIATGPNEFRLLNTGVTVGMTSSALDGIGMAIASLPPREPEPPKEPPPPPLPPLMQQAGPRKISRTDE